MAATRSKAIAAGQGRTLGVLGNNFRFKVTSDDTGDAFAVIEIESPPGGGIPAHINTRESETHIIVRGRYQFMLAGQTHEAPAGAVFFVSRGVPHAFQNVGSEPGVMLFIPSPARNNEAFIAKLAERFGGDPPAGPPDAATLEALSTLARQYGAEPVTG
jgi:quercetin dioxygenase-like cupin family protein